MAIMSLSCFVFKNWNWELFFNQFLKSVFQLLMTFCRVWHFHRFLIPHFDNFSMKLRRLSQIWRIYGAQKNVLQNFRQLMETLGACVQAYHVIIWNTRTPNVLLLDFTIPRLRSNIELLTSIFAWIASPVKFVRDGVL